MGRFDTAEEALAELNKQPTREHIKTTPCLIGWVPRESLRVGRLSMIWVDPNAPADRPAVTGKVRRNVLRHNKLPGNFRVKEFPARASLPDCALVEKEYAPGEWREYGIVGVDEFHPQNAESEGLT